MEKTELSKYTSPGFFLNSDSEEIIKYAKETVNNSTDEIEKSLKLYYRIRDEFSYNPYGINLSPGAYKADKLLRKKSGFCIEKANLLAACGRAVNIPTRLGFAIVQNHIGTEKLEKILRTNKLVFHGYMEFYLNGKWVKATPAFDKYLCEKLNVRPLEFNGYEDSIFQEYQHDGKKFMNYIHDYGQFADFPYELAVSELRKHYPHLFDENGKGIDKKIFFFED